MKGYVDVHCHILPGIDDGAANEQEMLRMVRIAHDEGIRHMIATPHYHPRRGEAGSAVIDSVFHKAKALIKENFADMKLYRGNEIYFRQDAKDMLKSGELLTLAGSDYVLIEFSTSASKNQIKNAVGQLQMGGYMPIIAHVERYEDVVGEYGFLEEMVQGGIYFQVNADAVIGEQGGAKKKFIKKMIKKDLVHFIGTDAHDSQRRPPLMEKCAAYVRKKFDEDTAEMLLYYNPLMIVKNKVI